MNIFRAEKNGRRMAGMSTWEAFFILLLLGGYFYIGMAVYEPVWARWKMVDILKTTMQEQDTIKLSSGEISNRIMKRMSINGIYGVAAKDMKLQKTDKVIRLTFVKSLPASLPFGMDLNVNINEIIEVERPKSDR